MARRSKRCIAALRRWREKKAFEKIYGEGYFTHRIEMARKSYEGTLPLPTDNNGIRTMTRSKYHNRNQIPKKKRKQEYLHDGQTSNDLDSDGTLKVVITDVRSVKTEPLINDPVENFSEVSTTIKTETPDGNTHTDSSVLSLLPQTQIKTEPGVLNMTTNSQNESLPPSLANGESSHLNSAEGILLSPSSSLIHSENAFPIKPETPSKFPVKLKSVYSLNTTCPSDSASNTEDSWLTKHEISSESFHKAFLSLATEGNYTSHQLFSAVETEFLWQTLPRKANPKSSPFVSLLLCSNASGEFKMNPMIVHPPPAPPALEKIVASRLPVYLKSSRDGRTTDSLFVEWFVGCAIPKIKEFLRSIGLPEKALIILESMPRYPEYLNSLNEGIKLVFLPRNSLLQPLDNEIINLLKLRYLNSLIRHLLVSSSTSEPKPIRVVLEAFTLKDAIILINEVWHSISQGVLNSSWTKLWSNVASLETLPCIQYEVDEIVKLSSYVSCEELNDLDKKTVIQYLELRASKEEVLSDAGSCPSTSRSLESQVGARYQSTPPNHPSTLNKKFEQYSLDVVHAVHKAMLALADDPDPQRSLGHLPQLRMIRNTYQDLHLRLTKMDSDTRKLFSHGQDSTSA